MILGIPRETHPGERRVALVPRVAGEWIRAGLEVRLQRGAGRDAGFPDEAYEEHGVTVEEDRDALFAAADVILAVRTPGASARGREDLDRLREGQVLAGFADPLGNPGLAREVARRGARLLAVELVPRITRAQSMDALSSQATVAGYKAALVAAARLPRLFPMLMTAAGTITPARVFVVGAGVAGLSAIATAKRLGAVVEAYDVRPAVREQVESLGARFVELELAAADAEDRGGYARELGEEFYRKQREMMHRVVAGSEVVITTAAIPGRRSPVLVTREMVEAMPPGSVIVDLAAERGGNCELTRADEEVIHGDVTILGPTNLPATVPADASRMYARNLYNLLSPMVHEGGVRLDLEDEVIAGCLVTDGGKVVHPRVRELLGEDAGAPTGGND